MFSVLILTKNEEQNIESCIRACRDSDDIVVFDSESTDRTVEIAERLGARVFSRTFDDYGSQREAARQVSYKNNWVLAVDADERPDPQLIREVLKISENNSDSHAAYRMRRKDHFLNRWIKYSSLYPSWFIRLYRPSAIRYEPRSVHEYPKTDGQIGSVEGHLLHYSFSKGLEEWFAKHVRYARLEAKENLSGLGRGYANFDWLGTMSWDPVRRRRALKELSFRLPFRSLLRFLYVYVLRRGFLDGIAGYYYARMISVYEEMIVLNMREIRASGAEVTDRN
jgi:glycosyltransferase involved in cell wall biosynthesis